MRRRHHAPHKPGPTIVLDEDERIARARRARKKGDVRKMLLALHEACLFDESSAWLWSLAGALHARHGRYEDARRLLRHALWLRQRAKDEPRARTTQMLLDRIDVAAAA